MNQKTQIKIYIDGANLHKGVADLGWELDYRRFQKWLLDKYGMEKAYMFMGLVPKFKDLYAFLQEAGYTLIFKETTVDGEGKIKGNCDAELVLKVLVDYYENNLKQAVLVASDGDYAGLVKFLRDKGVFCELISPNNKCSFLLRKLNIPIVYLDTQKHKLEKSPEKKKPPVGTEPHKGLLHGDK